MIYNKNNSYVATISADIVADLSLGDCGKGKVSSFLAASGKYGAVARWAGGNNAGHTVYVGGKKYKTHLIPSGVFSGILSIIGPGCVLHPNSFYQELKYLEDNGFDSNLVKVSPTTHIVTDEHIKFDKENLASKLGTTSKGIAPAYASKAARTGILARDILDEKYLWDGILPQKILCEGAQGFYLDENCSSYPYVTSSITIPYGACSLGFPPQSIGQIFGLCKAYDTRSGEDLNFLKLEDAEPLLQSIAKVGAEYGVTTGRPRKVNWLNVDMLINAINISGTTVLIMNKCDILEQVQSDGEIKIIYKNKQQNVGTVSYMKTLISQIVKDSCPLVSEIIYSYSPEDLSGETIKLR